MSSTNQINHQTQTKKSNDVKKLILEINQKLMLIRNPKQLQLASTDRVALDTNLLGLGIDIHGGKRPKTSNPKTENMYKDQKLRILGAKAGIFISYQSSKYISYVSILYIQKQPTYKNNRP